MRIYNSGDMGVTKTSPPCHVRVNCYAHDQWA